MIVRREGEGEEASLSSGESEEASLSSGEGEEASLLSSSAACSASKMAACTADMAAGNAWYAVGETASSYSNTFSVSSSFGEAASSLPGASSRIAAHVVFPGAPPRHVALGRDALRRYPSIVRRRVSSAGVHPTHASRENSHASATGESSSHSHVASA